MSEAPEVELKPGHLVRLASSAPPHLVGVVCFVNEPGDTGSADSKLDVAWVDGSRSDHTPPELIRVVGWISFGLVASAYFATCAAIDNFTEVERSRSVFVIRDKDTTLAALTTRAAALRAGEVSSLEQRLAASLEVTTEALNRLKHAEQQVRDLQIDCNRHIETERHYRGALKRLREASEQMVRKYGAKDVSPSALFPYEAMMFEVHDILSAAIGALGTEPTYEPKPERDPAPCTK